MTKQEKLNKLYYLYQSMGEQFPLDTKNELWRVILDLKVCNKAYFKSLDIFDLLKNDFNIKVSYGEFIVGI